MRMKQQLLFPGLMKEPCKPSKPVIPPKEECEVLYYGRFDDEDALIFIEKKLAEYNANIHTAMSKATDAGLTWGEFRERYPSVFNEIWRMLEECELSTFEEWLKERTKGRRRRSPTQLEEISAAKNEYMKLKKWDRMPLMEEPFVAQVILENAPLLEAPHDGLALRLPQEIIDEFGTVEGGFSIDDYVTFNAEDIKKVRRAFRRYGYLCKRNDRLIEKARGIV